MKNFVKLIKQVHAEKFSFVLKKILSKKIPVAFISAASISQAIETTKTFRAQGLNVTTLFVVDRAPAPACLAFDIIHVKDAANFFSQPEYIFANDLTAAGVALEKFPASKLLFVGNNTDEIYETFMAHLDDLQEVYESLLDEESKKVFRGYWLGNISNRLDKIVYANTPHYICAGFLPERGAVVIDGGLCDGGTALRFSQMGYEVYGFEMDRINYERTLKVAEEKNFVLENFGLGSYKHTARYNVLGHSGNKLNGNGAQTVPVTTIDAYVREKNLPRVDFIKMDVEGAELDILKGAATTIARYKPILALSAYHKWDDFWTLSKFIKSIRPDYEFALRQSYETPEEEPANFPNGVVEYLTRLGLEPDSRNFFECVLFAR